VSTKASLQRPWYLIAAMCLTWITGVFGATGGCGNISFLRGAPLPAELREPATDDTHPVIRSAMVRERVRLEELAKAHQVALPISIAKLILGLLLVLASGFALVGRPRSRSLALQLVVANAILALVEYELLTPVRDAMLQAAAVDAVEGGGLGAEVQELSRDEAVAAVQSLYLWVERLRLLTLEAGVYGGAALALTRQRTKDFFAAVAAELNGL